jgi:hypothetical protein
MGEAGITPEQAEEQLEVLSATGFFDFFNISGGGYHTLHLAVAPMNVEAGHMTGFAKRAKSVVGNRAKVFTVGRITDLYRAEQVLAEGCADMVAMTRAHFADPHIIRKTREGRENEIIRCLGANECIARIFDQRPAACVANPATGRESRWGPGTLVPVNGTAKRILVIGGGLGGMKTASVAAARGHHVTLWERADHLGGHITQLARFPTREGWSIAIDNLERAMTNAGVTVRLGVEATAESVVAEAADTVVIATGARWNTDGLSPWRPGAASLPGADQDHVLDIGTAADRALDDPTALGKHVVILEETGTYLPLGLAEILANGGVTVDVVTPDPTAGGEVYKTMDLMHLMPRLIEAGVSVTTQHNPVAIDGRAVDIQYIWGGPARRIENVDAVVMSMLRSPVDALYHALDGRVPELHRMGDALAPRKATQVMYEGEELGRAL